MKWKSVFKSSLIFALTLVTLLLTIPAASAKTGTWESKASLSTQRERFSTTVVDGKIYAIGGVDKDGKFSSVVEEYDPATDKWRTKAPMPTPRYDTNLEVIKGEIYATGGTSSAYETAAEKYNPKTDTWTTLKPFPQKTFILTAVINDKIYAFYQDLWVYDPANDTWTSLAKIPVDFGSIPNCHQVIDGKLYFFADCSNRLNNKLLEYDPTTNKWSIKAELSSRFNSMQSAVVNNKMYIIGGTSSDYPYPNLTSTYEYSTDTGAYTAKASMSTPRELHKAEVVDGKIYAIGGANTSGDYLSTVEEYDPALDKWKTIAPLKIPRCNFNAEVINGNIYVIGGMSKTGNLYTMEKISITEQPSLSITPEADKVTVGNQITTTIAIHNVSKICAEDVSINYDTNLFEYISAEAKNGLQIYTEDTAKPGTVRLVIASQGASNVATGDKDLVTLTFKAKSPGTGKVDIIRGRIADNATLETDVAAEDCGETTITVDTSKDVNRSGEVTLQDLGIDAFYYGMDASSTDSSKYDADVEIDGKIDSKDLTAINKAMLENSNYPPNNE